MEQPSGEKGLGMFTEQKEVYLEDCEQSRQQGEMGDKELGKGQIIPQEEESIWLDEGMSQGV